MEQTLALARNILTCAPKSPLSCTQFPRISQNPKNPLRLSSSAIETKKKGPRLGFRGGIRCSMDYNSNNGHYDTMGPHYPRPTEIQWKKELCNSVQLIGIIGAPVQIKQLNSGKVVAWSRLAVKKSATDTTWISLTFWDDLAHVASQHVEKGQQIYVSGRLISDTVESEDGKQQTYYKVVVQQLNFLERNFASGNSSSVALYDGDYNPMAAGKTSNNYAVNTTGSTEELWQAFFANPVDWWDNRKNKKNPRGPDFKHKDTGESLWIEGRYNPPWVKSQLAILDARMESFQDQNNGNGITSFPIGNSYSSF